jgi:hypothetical protein
VRREVAATIAKPAARPGQDQLGADAVRGGSEQTLVVEGMKPREGAEPCRPGGLDRGAQPVDDRDGRVERDARGAVGVPAEAGRITGVPSRQRVESTTAVGRYPNRSA